VGKEGVNEVETGRDNVTETDDRAGRGPEQRDFEDLSSLYFIKDEPPPQDREESLSYFTRLFGSRRPIVVEIGSGNGHFLVEYSKLYPDRNFIGTEILHGRARKFASKICKRGLKNIVVFLGDTRRFVWEFLYAASVEEFIVLFPDPWPKNRHRKHRLLSDRFIRMLRNRLVDGGKVSVATDHEEYKDFMISVFASVDGFESVFMRGYGDYPDNYPKTLFWDRFKKEGRPLYYLQWIKKTIHRAEDKAT